MTWSCRKPFIETISDLTSPINVSSTDWKDNQREVTMRGADGKSVRYRLTTEGKLVGWETHP